MGQTQRKHHLALPQGNGVDDRGLDFFRHHRVVGLDQADLRGHLHRDVARQLQIVQLLFKARAHIVQVLGCLSVLGQA